MQERKEGVMQDIHRMIHANEDVSEAEWAAWRAWHGIRLLLLWWAEEETSSQLFLSSLGCPASWSVWTRRTFMPRHSFRFCCPRCSHLETWTFYESLVSGTLLGACHAGGAQENVEFSGSSLRGLFLRPLVSGSHLCGVFYDTSISCSKFALGVQEYGFFWKTTSGMFSVFSSPWFDSGYMLGVSL